MNTKFLKHIVLIGCFALSQQLSAAAPKATYSSMPAVDCVINPYRVVDISSPVAGVIEKLHVERSQQVATGQVVAELEASVERANVELARYRAGVQSEIGLGKVNINFDQLRKKRVEILLEEQSISRENAEQIEREVQLSRWKLKQANELANIRRLELRKAEEQLRQKSISAPFDGFVLDTFKYRGEYVEDQAILRLAQLDPLVIEAIVPMENFGLINPGMQAEILLEVLLKEKLKGEVIAVDRIGDTASNTFGVKLSMPNPENRIPAGLKCIVKFLEPTPEQVAGEAVFEGQVVEKQLTAEPPGEVDSETPKALIERPIETTELSATTIAGQFGLLAAISDDNSANASITTPGKPDGLLPDGMQQPVVGPAARVEPEMTALSAKTPTSFMVLIEQPQTRAATQDLVEHLREAGVNDLLIFNTGVNKGHISLGVYNKRSYAVNRQRMLDQLGFTSFTIARYR